MLKMENVILRQANDNLSLKLALGRIKEYGKANG